MYRLAIVQAYVRAIWNQRRFSSRVQLQKWQERRVQSFLAKQLPCAAYYEAYARGQHVPKLDQLPILNKAQFMASFDALNTVGISQQEAYEVALRAEQSRDFSPLIGDVAVGMSSGTSGNRGIFLTRPAERAAWVGTMLAKVLPQSLLVRQRIAFFLRANNQLYESVNSSRQTFAFFDLWDDVSVHLDRLRALQPTIVVAPPYILKWLAEAQQAGELQIAPRKIISVAEVLEERDRMLLQDVFGQIIHQVYQCTEGFLAVTCAHGTLHWNEDVVHLEERWLDDERTRFSPILTDFSRTSQLMVRYQLDDVLVVKKNPCPCGSVFRAFESVEGRMDDVCLGVSTQVEGQLVPIFPDFIRRAIITASSATESFEYQVRQLTSLQLELRLSASATSTQEIVTDTVEVVVESLRQLFVERGCVPPQVVLAPYEPEQIGVKRRRVQRLFRRGESW